MIAARLFSVLSVVAVGAAAAILPRDDLSGLYAYGTGISGLGLYSDADGLAVIADETVVNITALGLSNVTWVIDARGKAPWNASAAATGKSGSFYIVPTSGVYAQAGFEFNTTSAPTDAATIGFLNFGSSVMYESGSDLLSKFWAQNTSVGTWNLMWNSDGTSQDDSVPVMLKTTAPVAITAEDS